MLTSGIMIPTKCPRQLGQTIPAERIQLTKLGTKEVADEYTITIDTTVGKPVRRAFAVSTEWNSTVLP